MTVEDAVLGNEPKEIVRGDRGEVGTASTADTLKQMWHDANFTVVDVNDIKNPRKQVWKRKGTWMSLRKYAKQLLATGTDDQKLLVMEWFGNKKGAKNTARSESNLLTARACASATKLSRKKTKAGGGK